MSSTQAASMRSKAFQAEEEHKIAAARLQWACWSDEPLIPAEFVFTKLDMLPMAEAPSETHIRYFNSLAEESMALVKVERSRYFPELSAGYISQKILPDKNLNAWTVGISIPIFFNTQRSKLRQAKFGASIAQNEASANIRTLNNKLEELSVDLRRYGEAIDFYTSSALPEAEALMKSAEIQLKQSETDISEYIQGMNSALEIKRAYAETLYLYNVAVLEYELYR